LLDYPLLVWYNAAMAKDHAKIALQPEPSVLAKLGSLLVHFEEMMGNDGHHFDKIALQSLIDDAEVQEWLESMRAMAMLPVKRQPKRIRQPNQKP